MNNLLFDGDKVLFQQKQNISSFKVNDVLIYRLNTSNYVKRCVAKPGDTISIVNGILTVNGKPENCPKTVLKLSKESPLIHRLDNSIFNYYLKSWTQFDFGPYIVPYKGLSVHLHRGKEAAIYHQLIREETAGNQGLTEVSKKDSIYTFDKNYFFFLGDNRCFSIDSRIYGPVAEERIFGKVIFVLFSKKDPLNLKKMFRDIN